MIRRKVTNGYRALWAAEGEADIRTVVDTGRLGPETNGFKTILQTVSASTSVQNEMWVISEVTREER